MLITVIATLLRQEVVDYQLIMIALFLGSAIGIPLAYLMPMTAVPQRTAISHACGALASALIGTAEYYKGQNFVNLGLFGLAVASGIALIIRPEMTWLFPFFAVLSMLFGVLLIVPI